MKYIFRHPYNDRTFSQIVRHFISFFVANIKGITHVHVPYPTKELNSEFETIFNIAMITDKTDKDIDVAVMKKQRLMYSEPDQNLVKMSHPVDKIDINNIFSDENINLMKKAYLLKTTGSYYNDKDINVCVHIRRGDIIKYGANNGRFTQTDFFTNTINIIHSIIPNCKFHVYSDSDIILNTKAKHIQYHINSDLLKTIHEMILADIFIMSIGSNMSQFAAIMSEGIVFLDKRKLEPCFNNNYNIYWAQHKNIITEENDFIEKIKRNINTNKRTI